MACVRSHFDRPLHTRASLPLNVTFFFVQPFRSFMHNFYDLNATNMAYVSIMTLTPHAHFLVVICDFCF